MPAIKGQNIPYTLRNGWFNTVILIIEIILIDVEGKIIVLLIKSYAQSNKNIFRT